MRSLASFAWAACLLGMGACVSLDKPSAIVVCEKNNQCSGGAGGEASDAERDSNLDQASVQDAVSDAGTIGASDRAHDRALADIASLDAAQDSAQDVALDLATDLPRGPCWSAGSPVAAGTVCRFPVGPCDEAEVCDGVSAACPADSYAPVTTVCRESKGDCDIAESCTGSSPDCPVDTFLTAGAICRPVAGNCDLAESCSGTGPDCPADSMVPAGTTCRASVDMNQCDPAEVCTGTSVSCPADVKHTRPSVPTGVAAAPGILPSTANISWTAVSGATGYNVKRSATTGLGYTTQGSPPTTSDVSYINPGLVGGVTYYYVVSSINTISTCESIGSPEVTVTATGSCTPPIAPTVTPTSANGRISLLWTASTGATSYSVGRSEMSRTGYLSVATVTTGTSYDDSNVANGTTYYYVVTASNGTCSSGNSVEVPAAPSCTPPDAPTNLGTMANNDAVTLTWDLVAGAVSYRVLRSTNLGADYALVGTSGVASYTDTSVTNGTTYYYVVAASNGLCNSVNSLPVTATPACTPPSRPTNLVAKPGNGKIDLTWDPSTGGAISYQVRRGTTTGGPYIALSTPTTTGFTDTSVVNGTIYYYLVSANGSCPSAPSAEVSAAPVCTPPLTPAIQAATPGDGQVTLSWTASTGTSVSYIVARGPASGGPYTDISGASLTVTTYTDSSLTNGTTYYYVVKATNGTCFSTSAETYAKPVPACAQAAPTGVGATAGNKQVTLTWAAPAGATSYVISRSKTSATGYTSAGTVNAPAVTFVDTDAALVNDIKYYYVVTASNGTCASPNSIEVSATPVCVPPVVPANVAAKADDTNGHIAVSWDAVLGATGYTVSRGVSASGPFVAASTDQTAATFTDSGLAAGTNYYYVVNASNAVGTCASVFSTPAVSAMSCSSPSVPSNVKATAGISRVTVSWTASTGSPDSYQVKRGAAAAGPFTSIGTPGASPYVDSGVTNGTTYYYVVAGRNASGNCSSANSAVVSTAPRSCRVVSGSGPPAPATSAGHPGKFLTTGPLCYVTCDTITNWNCYGSDYGSGRTIRINGSQLSYGGGPIPAPKTTGYNVIDISSGTDAQDEIWWWGTYNANSCTIPGSGLDF